MAKFYGEIGFSLGSVETPPDSGKYVNQILERPYFGDLVRSARRLDESPDGVNASITAANSVSIVADPYVSEHYYAIRYVKWAGTYWVVDNVTDDPDRPRLLLRLGGVYNGPKA